MKSLSTVLRWCHLLPSVEHLVIAVTHCRWSSQGRKKPNLFPFGSVFLLSVYIFLLGGGDFLPSFGWCWTVYSFHSSLRFCYLRSFFLWTGIITGISLLKLCVFVCPWVWIGWGPHLISLKIFSDCPVFCLFLNVHALVNFPVFFINIWSHPRCWECGWKRYLIWF